jgi:hypothetical protein
VKALSCAHWCRPFRFFCVVEIFAAQESETLVAAHHELAKSDATPLQRQACLQAAASALLKAGRLEEAELACLAWLDLARSTEKPGMSSTGTTQQLLETRERAIWFLLGKVYAQARWFEDAEAALLRAQANSEPKPSASVAALLTEVCIQQGKHKVR